MRCAQTLDERLRGWRGDDAGDRAVAGGTGFSQKNPSAFGL
jgi:hypothetical protein